MILAISLIGVPTLLPHNAVSVTAPPSEIVTMIDVSVTPISQSFKPPEEGAPGRREGGGTR